MGPRYSRAPPAQENQILAWLRAGTELAERFDEPTEVDVQDLRPAASDIV